MGTSPQTNFHFQSKLTQGHSSYQHDMYSSRKNNYASKCMLRSVHFPSCSWPVFSSILLSHCYYAHCIAVYIDYLLLNMPTKWTLQTASGNKFLRVLGSLYSCARGYTLKTSKKSVTQGRFCTKKKKKKKKMYPITKNVWFNQIYWLIDWYLSELSLPFMSSRWKKWFGPIRSSLSYHETRAEFPPISISFANRPMKEQRIDGEESSERLRDPVHVLTKYCW